MRVFLLLVIFIAFACGSGRNSNKAFGSAKKSSKPLLTLPENDNRALWKLISEKRDSVPVQINVNDTMKVSVVISGKIDSIYYQPENIRVFCSNGKQQRIILENTGMVWQMGQQHTFVLVDDINFDGFPDLCLFDNAGAVNYWYKVWLYKSDQNYHYSEAFSNTPCLTIDRNRRQVVSYYDMQDGCAETVGYYTIDSDTLKPIRYFYTRPEGESCVTYKKEEKSGAWTETNLGAWDLSLYDSLYLGH